jgi:hypothetical protein
VHGWQPLSSREIAIKEMSAAGYKLTKEHTFLERQYFLEFVVARN